MQEEKETNSSATESNTGAGKEAQAEEATSSETLSEVEKTEKTSAEKSETGGDALPSPDGAFDSEQGRGPKDDPGPM